MFREISPNSMMKALSIEVVPKRAPDKAEIENELNLMPVARTKQWKKVGFGDWGRGRSEQGSVVLGNEEKVVKMHVGKIVKDKNPMEWAREKNNATEIFKDVAPRTLVMLVDGVDGPRPAVLQDQIKGKPIYKASFRNEILRPEVLENLANIMRLTRKGLSEGYALDISGLRLGMKGFIFEKLLKMCPVFSDNIMIDTDKKIWLVDNVPDYFGDKDRGKWFNFKRKVEGMALWSWEMIFLSLKFVSRLERKIGKNLRSGVVFKAGENN